MPKIVLRVMVVSLSLAAPLAVACSSFAPADEAPDAATDGAAQVEGGTREDALVPPVRPSDASPDGSLPCDAGRACDERFVFVTRDGLPGSFGAPAGATAEATADAFCAAQASLVPTGSGGSLAGRTWKAFVCTSSTSAIDRIATAEARWINPLSKTVFPTTNDLRNGVPKQPIATTGAKVWTGCTPAGSAALGDTCGDWRDANGKGAYGIASAMTGEWLNTNATMCVEALPLYCFENAD